MKHIDLFSGIGGFALATEMVWDNVEHIFCDNDLFAQAVLEKHWPHSKIYGDIKTFTKESFTTDTRDEKPRGVFKQPRKKSTETGDVYLLTGGFPCQPFSQAGRRLGTEDDRHLWPEMLRVIREFHPRWIIGENVGGLVTWSEGMVLEQIYTELESEGYEVQAFIIPAVAVNAPHRRDRVWIIAHSKHNGIARTKKLGKNKKIQRRKSAREKLYEYESEGSRFSRETKIGWNTDRDWSENWTEVATRICRVDDGLPRRIHGFERIKELYENNNNEMGMEEKKPKRSFAIWEELRKVWEERETYEASFYLYDFGLCDSLLQVPRKSRPNRWISQEETAEEMRGLWQELYAKPYEEAQELQSRLLERTWEIERRKEMEQKKQRNPRLKSLGNAIVPQVAAEIMKVIKQIDNSSNEDNV